MGAVNLRWPPGRAAVEAVRAGSDIAAFVSVTEVRSIIDALEAGVLDRTIDEAQVNRSVLRVLRTKGVDPCTVGSPPVRAAPTAPVAGTGSTSSLELTPEKLPGT